ncbi:MAG: phosphate ABC transporter substrate-binding protein [Gammaproteobacteria bacterium]|nr:phosphate ABC transporter substrate-binding protein [Gammaproteobacteria bacterium]
MNLKLLISSILILLFTHNVIAESANQLSWVGCGVSKKAYMDDLAKAYQRDTGILINLDGGGATRGIRDVGLGTADIGGSCRYYLPDNQAEMAQSFEPLAWDALALIVHKSNPVQNLTLANIRDIYTGKLTNWKSLGGNDAPIELYTRKGKISGVGRSIRKMIFSDFNIEFASFKQLKSTGPIEEAVASHPNAIAITGISSARLSNVKILKLDNIYPDYKTIKKGNYELYRPLFLVYNPTSKQLPQIKRFITYAHSKKGRDIMKKNGVVPYMEAMSLLMKQMQQDQEAQQ